MSNDASLRPWSSLSAEEQTALLAAYQPVVDCGGPTCSFDVKLRRMGDWLRTQGISITESEVRGRPAAPSRMP